jgi:hypothetical protein
MRWRNRKKLAGEFGEPGVSVVPAAAGDDSGPAGGLPSHAYSPAFGAMLGIAAASLSEAHRYSEYVAGLSPMEALTPLRPGASPPASESRLQRQEARQALAALAATPVTAARIVKDITNALDLAVTAQEIHEGRSKQFPHAHIDRGGQIVIPEDEDDGDDAGQAV